MDLACSIQAVCLVSYITFPVSIDTNTETLGLCQSTGWSKIERPIHGMGHSDLILCSNPIIFIDMLDDSLEVPQNTKWTTEMRSYAVERYLKTGSYT